jgi:hypothetical protein
VAERHGVSLATVQLWVARAAALPLDAVDWRDRPSVRHRSSRTDELIEGLVLETRRRLREESALGEYGAAAIHREIAGLEGYRRPLPAVRTIGRILGRGGVLDPRRRRHVPPPPGWYLPDVAARQVELDLFDVVEGTLVVDDRALDVLTGISLHGGLASAWPTHILRAGHVEARLLGRWRESGRPGYAQFDNASRFAGGMSVPDSIGDVIRFCLALDVVPVFAPPREPGFQAPIESFNGLWQRKVWARRPASSLAELQAGSTAYIEASRARHAVRIADAPPRRPLPHDVPFDLRQPKARRIVLLRRTSDTGAAVLLGRRYVIDPAWVHRLVRAELDLVDGRIDVFAMRRADPGHQPQIAVFRYDPPARWFR